MKYIMCSRVFPKGHPKAGEPTAFVEKILNTIYPGEKANLLTRLPFQVRDIINDFYILDGTLCKPHTIRAGSRFKTGDMVSLRVWSDKPYRSKQIEFAQVEVKNTWEIEICQNEEYWVFTLNGKRVVWDVPDFNIDQFVDELAKNDGLNTADFLNFFSIHPKKKRQTFMGQIISWSDSIEYSKPSLLTENKDNE